LGGLRKGSVYSRGRITALDKKVSHLQTFGLKIFVFAADAAKTKELREGNRPFGVVGVGRGK
jgi:hypothetical protein